MTVITTPATASATAAPGPAASPAPRMGRLRTADGLELASYRWPPGDGTAPPRATIALVHGLAEHAGRYAALATRLNAAGIEVLAIDLRGHGQSPGKRAWVERFDGYLIDADALVAEAARDDTPLFLMGHSMGGAVAALYAIERVPARGYALAGLVLSSPALAPGRDVPRWMLAMSRIISRIWPTFPAIRIDAALLSRDPAIVAANRADPLVHHGAVPARTGAEILDAMARIERGRGALRECVEELVDVLRVLREEVPVLGHEVGEVLGGVLAPAVLLEQLVEVVEHLRDGRPILLGRALEGLLHAGEALVEQLAAEEVLDLLVRLTGLA